MSHIDARPIPSSYRLLSEQLVGLGVIALSSFAFAAFSLLFFKQGSVWFETLDKPAWLINSFLTVIFFTAFHAIFAICFWMIWRRNSLRVLKLELSIFLSGFILETIWAASLSLMHQLLPALIALLIWMCGAIALGALFWKRDKIAGKILALPLIWIVYLITVNMMLCIANN